MGSGDETPEGKNASDQRVDEIKRDASGSSPAFPERPTPIYEIGILFDTGNLDKQAYRSAAFRIFFDAIDPEIIKGSVLYDGETCETRERKAGEFLIVVQSYNEDDIEYVRRRFIDRSDRELASLDRRFFGGNVIAKHSLSYAGVIDTAGCFIVQDASWFTDTCVNNTKWKVASRSELLAAMRGRGETILVVEDEKVLQDLLRMVLTDNGYTVMAAYDGEQAIDLYVQHQESISLVLSDIGLPKINGIEVLTELKSIDPWVKVILVTGFNILEEKNGLMEKGAFAIIQKPYKLDHILKTIRSAIDTQIEGMK